MRSTGKTGISRNLINRVRNLTNLPNRNLESRRDAIKVTQRFRTVSRSLSRPLEVETTNQKWQVKNLMGLNFRDDE
jgi:hypothetical protein